jgi:protocatechuate 3,4-dioxygenase beta subunit
MKLSGVLLFLALAGQSLGETGCPPTRSDALGPFYKPDAPVRSVLGAGYELKGTVRSSVDCGVIPKARIEVWQAGPDGEYSDAYRATIFSDTQGNYRLQTARPPRYSFWRPPHIHILVEAPGFKKLITQHYPEKGTAEATFDLVLVPETSGKGKSSSP